MRKLLFAFLLLPSLALAQTQHGRIAADAYANKSIIVITGATPTVSLGNIFKTNNGGPTTITNFLGGITQGITIICGDAQTTIANNANIVISGGLPFTCAVNQTISFIYDVVQLKWIQNSSGSGGGGTFSGTGPLLIAGKEGTCSGAAAGFEVLCLGDSVTHNILISKNGGAFAALSANAGTPTNSLQYNNAGSFTGSSLIFTPVTGLCNSPVACDQITDPNELDFLLLPTVPADNIFEIVSGPPVNNGTTVFIENQTSIAGKDSNAAQIAASVDPGGTSSGVAYALSAFGTDELAVTATANRLAGVKARAHLNRAAGHTVTVSPLWVAPPTSAGGAATEIVNNFYALDIADQLGLANIEYAPIKIRSQTTPAGGTKFSIKADAGSGVANFGDGVVAAVLTDSALTSGNCVQAAAAGLLTTSALPCVTAVASGTAVMTTAGITTGACGTTVTVVAAGVLTTDPIDWSHNAAATNGNGGNLILNAWPTSGNVNFNYCNPSAGTITPTAMTINWSVRRP